MVAFCALVVGGAAGLGGLLSAQGQVLIKDVQAEPSRPGGDSVRPIPLINIDEEMGGYLKNAQEMIEKQDYGRAIEILHALLNRSEQCFVPTSDTRRFVSLALRVSEAIGKMPPEGLKLYRRLHDPEAEQLFRQAAAARDEPALGQIVRRFFHTSFGDDALNLLGGIYFDCGLFSQAARCWRDILESHTQGAVDAPVLLAKIAVAHHFAGERSRAEEAVKRLEQDHAQAEAVLGGARQNALAYVRKVLSAPAPEYAAEAETLADWRSLAGSPDSVAVMTACRPVLSPRWLKPGGRVEDNANVKAALQVGVMTQPMPAYVRSSGGYQEQLVQREGRVYLNVRQGNRTVRADVPATIHPIVVGESVLYRSAEGVVAHDLFTGEKLWESFNFPLFRPVQQGAVRQYYSYGVRTGALADAGVCALTAGEGKVFAVGRFLPPNLQNIRMAMARQGRPMGYSEGSALAAFSLTGEGRLVWMVGEGKGNSEVIQGCRFVTAPTYAAGRLYALVEYAQAYHLLCLHADSGNLVWSAMVGQMPVPPTPYPYGRGTDSRGSPPAVADGRVFAVTNAGVLAAFDGESGRALWAYQYPSALTQFQTTGRVSYPVPGQLTTGYPGNPVVVTRGKAISLPADSEQLLAVRVDTGELVWSTARNALHHLTAVDDGRVLLAGEKLCILDANSGQTVWAPEHIAGVFARPAVTRDAILASGKGEIVRVSLSDFSVTRPPLVQTDGILGNLVSAGGKLVAGNAAGISAYFAYEDAREELTQRMASAPAEERPALLHQRGMNAFNAGKPDEALPDLLASRQGAQSAGDGGLLARAEQSLYRTYVSLGDRASDSAVRLDYFLKAQELAGSDRTKAEMLVRLAKHYELVGEHDRSAGLFHQLTTDYPETDVVDVEIGSEGDPFVRDDPDTPRTSGYELGHRKVRGLIAQRGQECYAAFDAKAREALAAAVAGDDPDAMLAVVKTYRHSVEAPVALLRSAESYYRRASKAPREKRSESLGLADQYLGRIIREYANSPQVSSAWLGLAVVRNERNPRIAWRALRGLERLPQESPVAFAGTSGSVGEVLKRFASLRRPERAGPPELLLAITPPLAPVLEAKDPGLILRRPDGEPVRLGQKVFFLSGNKLALFDASAKSSPEAVQWQTVLPVDANRIYRFGFSAWAYSLAAGLSEDGSVLALVTRGGLVGVDTAKGQVVWKTDPDQPTVAQFYAVAMDGDELVILLNTGQIIVLDKRTGKELWQHRIGNTDLPWRSAPQVANGLLLTCHGAREPTATLYDMNTRKVLGSVRMGPTGLPQVHLTSDELLLLCDGQTLKLIEPISGLDEPVWSVRVSANNQARILAANDQYVVIAPNTTQGVVEVRSLLEDGGVVETFQTRPVKGATAIPFDARIVGDRLYVLAGAQAVYSGHPLGVRVFSYCRDPSLHAFEISTGRTAWEPVDLSGIGAGGYVYVSPPEVAGKYVCVLCRAQPFTRPGALKIIDAQTGKDAQPAIVVPGVEANPNMDLYRLMFATSPVLTEGRLALDTARGLVVYGQKE